MPEAATETAKPESMEDILQSIKRIIEDDTGEKTPVKAEEPEDILDLTQIVKNDGTDAPLPGPELRPAPPAAAPMDDVVKSIDAMFTKEETAPPAAAAKLPEPEPVPEEKVVVAAPAPTVKTVTMEDKLVSDEAAQAAVAALKPIKEGSHKDYSIPRIASPELRSGNTVEDLMLEALKPMLKAWLDEHLPTIVQKIVEKEVKRLVAFHQD